MCIRDSTVTVLTNVYADGDIEASYERALATIGEVRETLNGPLPRPPAPLPLRPLPDFTSNMPREQFEAMVARIIEYILSLIHI